MGWSREKTTLKLLATNPEVSTCLNSIQWVKASPPSSASTKSNYPSAISTSLHFTTMFIFFSHSKTSLGVPFTK
eukprot:12826631-Ditylum_brightwellii.AAC.1